MKNDRCIIQIDIRARNNDELKERFDKFTSMLDDQLKRRNDNIVVSGECGLHNGTNKPFARITVRIANSSTLVPYIFMTRIDNSNDKESTIYNRYEITIRSNIDEEDMFLTRERLHDQLVGNEDYINNCIVLSDDSNKEVVLLVGAETDWHPQIFFIDGDLLTTHIAIG